MSNATGPSTVYATSIYTVTSCAASITNCPVGSLSTELVSLYTTNGFAVSTSANISATQSIRTEQPESLTRTVYATQLYTVTSCAASITNCPARSTSVSTSLSAISTTVIPNTLFVANNATSTALGQISSSAESQVLTASQAFITSIVYETSTYTVPTGSSSGQLTTTLTPVSTSLIPVQEVELITSVVWITSMYTQTTGISSGQVITASSSSASVIPATTEYITKTVYDTQYITVTTGISSGLVQTSVVQAQTTIPAKPVIIYVTSIYTVTAGASSGQITTSSAASTTIVAISDVVSASAVPTPDAYTSVVYLTSIYTLSTGSSSGIATTEQVASTTVIPVNNAAGNTPPVSVSNSRVQIRGTPLLNVPFPFGSFIF